MGWGNALGAVLQIGFGIQASNEERTSQRYAKKAADIRLKQQALSNAISRRDTIRKFRITQAQQAAAATSEAGVTSSLVSGSAGSLVSQLSGNLNYFDTQERLDYWYNDANKQAGKYMNTAGNYAALSAAGPAIGQLAESTYNTLAVPKSTS